MQRPFAREKYKELVLYIVNRCTSNPRFGSILLNKILVDCDFSSYVELERPLTGQKVQHEPMGPISAPLVPITRELEELDGALTMHWTEFFGNPQRRYEAKREADIKYFSPQELELVDRVISSWSNLSGKEASDLSHERFGGWVFTNDGDEIVYDSAYISLRPLTPEAFKYARDLI